MAEVNYNSITSSFAIPYEKNGIVDYKKFAFVIDENGIIFIDKENTVETIISSINSWNIL